MPRLHPRRACAYLLVTAFVVLHASETAARGDDGPMPATPSALERSADGWVDLLALAGPDLKGWTRASIPPGRPIDPSKPSQWSYDPEKRILTCRGDGGHDWIRWNEELGDAVFHVEWRFVPVEGKSRYNSGVYARNSADARIWHQAQTGDGSGGYLFGDTPVEGKLQRFKPSYKAKDGRVKRAGEWNTYEITCKGREISLWSNGAVTCVVDACDVPRGYVGLEAEGYLIEFRNVKVKKLDR